MSIHIHAGPRFAGLHLTKQKAESSSIDKKDGNKDQDGNQVWREINIYDSNYTLTDRFFMNNDNTHKTLDQFEDKGKGQRVNPAERVYACYISPDIYPDWLKTFVDNFKAQQNDPSRKKGKKK